MRWAATQQRTEQCHTITSLFLAVMQYSNRFAIQQKLYFVVQHCRGLATFLYLVSWCFEPSQPQRITSGLNTNLLYLQVIYFTSHFITSHAFFYFSLFLFREHSTRELASNRVTYFILRAYTGTSASHNQHRKNWERFWKKCRWMGRKVRSKQGRNPWQ